MIKRQDAFMTTAVVPKAFRRQKNSVSGPSFSLLYRPTLLFAFSAFLTYHLYRSNGMLSANNVHKCFTVSSRD